MFPLKDIYDEKRMKQGTKYMKKDFTKTFLKRGMPC